MKSKTIVKRQQKDKEAVIENLKRMPIIEIACNKSGVSRATYYRWKEQDLAFSQAVDKAQEEGEALIRDVAVSKIIKGINDDNLTAAMYWLNHRDPRFSNKVEISTTTKPQEALSKEQEDAVKKALALTGLSENDQENKS
jgi:hypothetical protein